MMDGKDALGMVNDLLKVLSRIYTYCCCLVAKSCPTLVIPWTVAPPSSSVHRILQARILEWVANSGDLPDPGMETASLVFLHWQANSLPLSHQRSSYNIVSLKNINL